MLVRSSLTVLLVCAAPAIASVAEYQPALGTMPSAQAWTYEGDGAEIGSVSGGVFSYGPTATAAVHYWGHDPIHPVDFSIDTWHIEASVRLTDTFFGNNSGFRRGGFVLILGDDFGSYIVADLGDSALGLRNDNSGVGDPSAAFDLGNGFHTVRLEAGPAGARLSVDGVPQLSLELGAGGASGAQWGEGSILAYSGLTEVGFVNVVPAPGAAVLLALGGLGAARRRR